MNFCIPKAKDKTQQTAIYDAIREFAAETLGWRISDRRVFSVHSGHEEFCRSVAAGRQSLCVVRCLEISSASIDRSQFEKVFHERERGAIEPLDLRV